MKITKPSHFFIFDLLFIAILVGILFGGTLFTSGQLIYSHDITYFYPNEVVMEASGYGDNLPLWNPYYGAGYPGLGKIQVGMFYIPLMLLRSLFSVETTLNLDVMLHLFVAGSGMYILMRQLSVARTPALFTAIAFMLSGSFSPRIFAGHASIIRSIAWTGWLLFAYIKLLHKPSWKLAVLTSVFIGFVMLGGHPQMSLIVLLIPLSYFFARFIPDRVREKEWSKFWHGLGWSITAVILALGLTAIQTIPYILWQSQTVRPTGNAFESLEALTAHSFLWQHFLTFFMPTIWFDMRQSLSITLAGTAHFWENSAFTGVLTLLIIALGMMVHSKKHLSNRRFFIGLAFAGLFFSMGTINPIYKFLYQTMPYIRAPGRFMLWWTFGISISAGLALDILLKQKVMPIKPWKMGIGLMITAIILLTSWWQFNNIVSSILSNSFQFSLDLIQLTRQTFTKNIILLAITLGFTASLLLLISRWEKYQHYTEILLIAGISLEMVLFTIPITPPMPLAWLNSPESPFIGFDFQADTYRFDGGREPPLHLIPTLVHVYNGEENRKFTELLGILNSMRNGASEGVPNGLNLLAANFRITDKIIDDDQWLLLQQQNEKQVYTYRDNLPRIYAAPVVRQVTDEGEALQIVGDLQF
ncbi:MAG: hypothetical protein KAI17_02460, partial [Thiotrichaceae bacterium]|nr:hypothetical protein [Thiotrichaceae bacterium]